MGWSYTYNCTRLGYTINKGDKIKIKGQSYTSAYKDGLGYNYTTAEEKAFYGVYSDSSTVVTAPLCVADSYGNAQYYITDDMIVSVVTGTPTTCSIKLNANGGNLNYLSSTYVVTYGSSDFCYLGDIGMPTRQGYTCTGFYTATSGGEQVWDADGNAVNGTYWNGSGRNAKWKWIGGTSLTVYAQWEINGLRIRFNSNGGELAPETIFCSYGETIYIPDEIPHRNGYIFKGWTNCYNSTDIIYQSGDAVTLSTNMVLFAVWELKENYFLKFDILSCWRSSDTTAQLVVKTQFADFLDMKDIQLFPSLLSSTHKTSINSVELLSPLYTNNNIVDEVNSSLIEDESNIITTYDFVRSYTYKIVVNIEDTNDICTLIFELNDGIHKYRKSVRVSGSDNIYLYEYELKNISCEAIDFIQSDTICGFQKGGRVYAKEFAENEDGSVCAFGIIKMNRICERGL